jgi:glycosyltransferase involved in cell wall biosynthesis
MSAAAHALRLGLVGPLPPPSGGMANQTRQLAALLRGEGLSVTIARTNEPLQPAWLQSLRFVRGFLRQVPYRRSLAALVREADVMHVMANSGLAWFLLAAPAIAVAHRSGVPVVVNYRGGLAREFLQKSARRVLAVLRLADALVVPTSFLRDVFAEHGVAAQVIPNVVDVGVFAPSSTSRSVGDAPHIIVTRNLERIYGIDVALRAAALVRKSFPGLRMSIAGTGPERAALEALSANLGLADAVRFTGRLEVAQMAALYRDADIVLNASRVDNTPNALLEAAASGVPIVSTDAGGIPHLLQHGKTAWLAAVDSHEQLASGAERVLKDEGLRKSLREGGLALAHSCSWPVVRAQWLGLYERLATKSHRSAIAAVPGR